MRPEHEQRIAEALALLGVPLSISQTNSARVSRVRTDVDRRDQRLSAAVDGRLSQSAKRSWSKRTRPTKNPKTKDQRPKLLLQPARDAIIRWQHLRGRCCDRTGAHDSIRTIRWVVGALRAARAAGFQNIITFDMGGTSTDVALCDRDGMRLTNEAIVAGLPVAVSVMDIHTVGAGGGSIARVDEGGSLRVGPESAGADPGPACYGRSLLPTVTDAHVVLGHFGGGGLLGGEFKLDEERAHEALTHLAKDMSKAAKRKISAIEAAQGVLVVVNTNMERALRRISVERGHDPREFVLLPFGGAGGLHAVELARALRIPRIIAPTAAGALSAIGVLVADVVKDQSRTVMLEVGPGVEVKLEHAFREMERSARVTLRCEGFAATHQRHERALAMRYLGQSFEMEIKQTTGAIGAAFHRAHQARYGYAQTTNTIEIVSARLRSIGVVEKLKQDRLPASRQERVSKPLSYAEVFFDGKRVRAGIYRRGDLPAGAKLRAPCIVTEYSSTTLIPSGVQARVDSYGNLIINFEKPPA